jgi:leucyl aminopeptidase
MRWKIEAAPSSVASGTAVIVPVLADEGPKSGASSVLGALGVDVAALKKRKDLPEAGEGVTVRIGDGAVIVVTLAAADANSARAAVGRGTRLAIDAKLAKLAVVWEHKTKASAESIGQAIAEGVLMGGYRFWDYKSTKPEPTKITDVSIASDLDAKALKSGLEHGEAIAGAVNNGRDYVTQPANVCTPMWLAKQAQGYARPKSGLTVKIHDKKALEKMKMGLFLGVAQGSGTDTQPCMVEVTYKGGKANEAPIIFVGKGLCFDSGGLNIKLAEMEKIKWDMGGAGAVLGLMSRIADMGIKRNVIGIAGCAQNLVDAESYRPGDVLIASNGKSVEIGNTDAEGRLVLADCLVYASKMKPAAIIDMATLTGAIVVSLGKDTMGIFSEDEAFAAKIRAAATEAGELSWPMPMWKDTFQKLLKSDIADMNNIGGRYGGSCSAAAFLRNFVDDGIPYAHLDIAGVAWADSDGGGHQPVGASGRPIRALVELLKNW